MKNIKLKKRYIQRPLEKTKQNVTPPPKKKNIIVLSVRKDFLKSKIKTFKVK